MAFSFVFALPMTAAAAPRVDSWAIVDVSLYDLEAGKTPTLVITGLLDEDIVLPAQVAIGVPAGASLVWAGEILGGDPSMDPPISIELVEENGYQLAVFQIERSRRVQLELSVPPGWVSDSETGRSVELAWTSPGPVDRARVGVSLPRDAHMEQASPEPAFQVRPSDVFYSVETSPVAAGQTLELSGLLVAGPDPSILATPDMSGSDEESDSQKVETGPASEGEPDPAGASDPTPILIAALAVALVAAGYALYLQLRKGSS